MDSNTVYVYFADISGIGLQEAYNSIYDRASGYVKERISKLRPEKEKLRCLCAFWLLNLACKELGIEGYDSEIAVSEHGKPYFKEHGDVYFNVSHSGDRVMCAVSNAENGCDVQKIKPVNLSMARFFTEREQNAMKDITDINERNDHFFTVWTLKESFVKCDGRGLGLPFDRFEISKGVTPEGYSSCSFEHSDGYKYACVAKKSVKELSFESKWLNLK